jgi:hypothetical protein
MHAAAVESSASALHEYDVVAGGTVVPASGVSQILQHAAPPKDTADANANSSGNDARRTT